MGFFEQELTKIFNNTEQFELSKMTYIDRACYAQIDEREKCRGKNREFQEKLTKVGFFNFRKE